MIELTQFQLNVLSDFYYELMDKLHALTNDAVTFKEEDKSFQLEQLFFILKGFYEYDLPKYIKRET